LSVTPIVELNDVSLIYNVRSGFLRFEKRPILQSLDLSIQSGETLGVIGRNGAGKSTLLTVLSGVQTPTSGEIRRRHSTSALLTLSLGYDGRLSGRENAILQGLFLGFRYREIVEQLEEIINYAELSACIDDALYTYSAGMKARLGFSVCHFLRTDILLIDEMLGVGDEEFRAKSSAALKSRIVSSQTVILVSHQLRQIAELCERTVWLEGGRICKVGPTLDVLRAYRADMH